MALQLVVADQTALADTLPETLMVRLTVHFGSVMTES
jgi:hypothetical protein